MSETEEQNITSIFSCPYCHAYTYEMTFIPYGGGILAKGVCKNCNLKGQSFSEAEHRSMAATVLKQVQVLGVEATSP